MHFAAELATALIKLHDEEKRLDQEGSVIAGKAGFPKLNPRAGIVDQLSRRCMQLARHLRIHPASDGREAAKASAAARPSRMHALGWPRSQAILSWRSNSPFPLDAVVLQRDLMLAGTNICHF